MSLFIPNIETRITAILDNQLTHDLNLKVNISTIKNKPELKVNQIHNAKVAEKYQTYLTNIHQSKITNVKAIVDTSPPKYMRNSHARRSRMDKDRIIEIEKQNTKLYQKIISIKPSIPKTTPSNPLMSNSLQSIRMKERKKIELENVKIASRIDKARNKTKASNWKEDRQQNLEYLKSIARYPKKFYIESEILHKRPNFNVGKE